MRASKAVFSRQTMMSIRKDTENIEYGKQQLMDWVLETT